VVEVLLQIMDKPIQSDQAIAIPAIGLIIEIVQPEVAIVEVIIAQLHLADRIRQVLEVVHQDPVVGLQVQEAAQAGGKCLITM
jgi:hypothetical protein